MLLRKQDVFSYVLLSFLFVRSNSTYGAVRLSHHKLNDSFIGIKRSSYLLTIDFGLQSAAHGGSP